MAQVNYLIYLRKSDVKQTMDHQREDIRKWLDDRDIPLDQCEFIEEQGSGAKARNGFTKLMDKIKNSTAENVLVWEISRIARKGKLAQEFFDVCEENGTTVHVAQGSIDKIESDGTNRIIADILAAFAAQERRDLIRRTRSGVREAKNQGKWLGNTPTGFRRDEAGYLTPIINPEPDETSYIEVQEALEDVATGTSYNQAAKSLNISRQTLADIDQTPKKRKRYMDQEAEDDRVSEALDYLDT